MLKKGDRVILKTTSSMFPTDPTGEVLEVHPSYVWILGDQSGQWQQIQQADIASVEPSKKGTDG